MRSLSLLITLAVALAFPAELAAHGGTYRGPQDIVPPGGGGVATPTPPGAPPPPNPGTPPPPVTGTPTPPGVTPPNVPPIPQPPPRQPVTDGGPMGDDLTRWVYWWEFNKEPFLNLKAKVHGAGVGTGVNPLTEGLGGYTSQVRTFKPTAHQIANEVIPALREALEESDSIDIQSSCLVALAKVGTDRSVVGLIRERLRHPHPEVSETAALSLGILQDPVVLPELEDLALDTDAGRALCGADSGVRLRTRVFAVYGLGLVANASGDPSLRTRIAERLWGIAGGETGAVPDLRVAAIISLGLTRLEQPESMLERLAGVLADGGQHRLIRAHCPTAMAKLIQAGASPGQADRWSQALLALVAPRSKAPNAVRQSVVQASGLLARSCGDLQRVEIGRALRRLADDGADLQERNLTAISLAYLGAALPDAHPLRDSVQDFLLQKVLKGSSSYRPWAGLALGVMAHHLQEAGASGPSSVVGETLLGRFLKEKAPSRKAAYAVSLGLMRFGPAKGPVAEAMRRGKDGELRGYCAISLGLLGASEHREAIQEVVRESSRRPEVLRQAAVGLGLMNDHEVLEVLLARLQPEDGKRPALSVLSSVATAIGFIGDHRSVTPLVRVLRDDRNYTPLGRAFAAAALGLVVDKQLLPWNSSIAEDLNYRAAVVTLVDNSLGSGVLDIL